MPDHTCQNCGIVWHRPPTRGQVPKWCPDCRTWRNGGRVQSGVCASCGTKTADRRCIRCKPCEERRRQPNLTLKQCTWCYATHLGSGKFCGTDCRSAAADHRARKMRGPLRTAIEDADYASLLREIAARCTVTSDGCWNWDGCKQQGAKGGGPYPIYQRWQVHRLALEAKLGASLGTQTAHHICANSLCVNPDHLQQVTSRENVAEMLARNDYVRRIAALEKALAAERPGHQLLAEAPLAGVLRSA